LKDIILVSVSILPAEYVEQGLDAELGLDVEWELDAVVLLEADPESEIISLLI
jgi:hypothetical protein